MRRNFGFAAGILFGWGMLLMLSPVAVYLFIHGDAARVAWITSGPDPLGDLGGGANQVRLYAVLFATGVLLLAAGIILGHNRHREAGRRHGAWLV